MSPSVFSVCCGQAVKGFAMAAADTVDSQLRNAVRAARSRALRCIKAIISGRSSALKADVSHTLSLANTALDEGQSLDKEFQRCVKSLLEADKPSFLLFRADMTENIEGGRWLLLAWLPDSVPEIDRTRYVRSRGLLADLVPQPYFLGELLVREPTQLVWPVAAAVLKPKKEDSSSFGAPSPKVALEGPVRLSQTAQSCLQRLANREESCLKLVFSGRFSLKRLQTISEQLGPQMTAPVLEAKVMDCRSPSQLAKTELPSTSCYFALLNRDDLVFVHWCPDRMSRDPFTRMRDDSRYAVLKSAVLSLLLETLKVRLLQVEAREPQELVDHANRADERLVADLAASKALVPLGYPERSERVGAKFPEKGKADWPMDWPKEAEPAMPANLSFFVRPVPHWKGGSKAHSIQVTSSLSNARSKLARKTVREAM